MSITETVAITNEIFIEANCQVTIGSITIEDIIISGLKEQGLINKDATSTRVLYEYANRRGKQLPVRINKVIVQFNQSNHS